MRRGAKREYCVRGHHKMDKENTWERPSGGRYCRKCMAASRLNYSLGFGEGTRKPKERRRSYKIHNEAGERIKWSDLFPIEVAF
jgi:hypothetical protein